MWVAWLVHGLPPGRLLPESDLRPEIPEGGGNLSKTSGELPFCGDCQKSGPSIVKERWGPRLIERGLLADDLRCIRVGFGLTLISAPIAHLASGDSLALVTGHLTFLAILGISYFYYSRFKNLRDKSL